MRVGAGRGRAALLLGALLALSAAPAAAQNAGVIAGHSHSNTNVDCTARLGTHANGLVVENDQAVQTEVTTVSTSGIAGHTTYRVALHLAPTIENVYTIYGDSRPMEFPPAYQVAKPFGADIGGVNPQFLAIRPEVAFDSWLTVGITGGNDAGLISKIGIDFDSWSDTIGLVSAANSGGAVFWMDPDLATNSVDRGVAGAKTVTIAQLTVRNELGSTECHFDAQGRSLGHSNGPGGVPDWEENCIALFVGGPQNGQGSHCLNCLPPPPPPPPPPMGGSGAEYLNGNNRCDTALLRNLQNGEWITSGGDALTQQASVQCRSGVAQGPTTRSCQRTGFGQSARWEWFPGLNAQPTTCVSAGGSGSSATCPNPSTVSVRNGYFQLSGPTTAELYCNPSFVKPTYGSTSITCDTRTGRWGSFTSQCNPAPPPPYNTRPPPSPPGPSPTPPTPGPPTPTPDDSSSTSTIVVVVLLLLGAAGGVYAKQNGLGPFAEGDGKKAVMGDPDAGGSTIYDQQTDESL